MSFFNFLPFYLFFKQVPSLHPISLTLGNGCHLLALPLSRSRAPVFPKEELLHVWWPRFCGCHKGTNDHVALEAKGACVPGSHGTVTERQFMADCHSHGTVQTSNWNIPTLFLRKTSIGALAWGADFWFCILIGAYGGPCGEWRQWAQSALSLPHSRSVIFRNVDKGNIALDP